MEEKFIKCGSDRHFKNVSIYPKDKVPIENFFKDKKNPDDLYKTCLDCRDRNKKYKQNSKSKYFEQSKLDLEYSICCSDYHDKISKISRKKVAKEMFLKKDGTYSRECSECREHNRTRKAKEREKKRNEAKESGKYLCTKCFNFFDEEEMGKNSRDEKISTSCHECKSKEKGYNKKYIDRFKEIIRNIKLEKINKLGSCCEICNSIFLKPEEGKICQRELETYLKDDIRYVKYNNAAYKTNDFLQIFEKELELINLDLDHLPEDEQRKRGIIGPDDTYIKKRGKVSNMISEKEMRKEAKITQIVCCKCHLIITMKREKGDGKQSKQYMEKERYINGLRKQGCQSCGFYDETILRFLEFDHENPHDKESIISDIVRMKKYDMEFLIKECSKCRILCRCCHRIHSREQRKEQNLSK